MLAYLKDFPANVEQNRSVFRKVPGNHRICVAGIIFVWICRRPGGGASRIATPIPASATPSISSLA